jgi:hypothetical protein
MMNVLLIWIGEFEPLSEYRNACIKRVLQIYPRANFKVITKLETFYGMETIHPDTFPVGVDSKDFLSYSDYARLKYLSENEDTLYIDSDTWCEKPFDFGDRMGSAFFEAIWSGKETQVIKRVLEKAEGRLISNLGSDLGEQGENLFDYFTHGNRYKRDIA